MDSKTFVEQMARKMNKDTEEILTLLEGMSEALASATDQGDVVAFPSFGSFEVKKHLEREGVHPASGKRWLYPPKLSLIFRPSAILKQKFKN